MDLTVQMRIILIQNFRKEDGRVIVNKGEAVRVLN
jgi:hypothetical protein